MSDMKHEIYTQIHWVTEESISAFVDIEGCKIGGGVSK